MEQSVLASAPPRRPTLHPRFRQMHRLEARKAELGQRLAHAEGPLPLIQPEMASFCRQRVATLHLELSAGEGEDRTEAAERLHSLVSKIVPDTGRGGRLGEYVYGVTHLDRSEGNAPTLLVRITSDFTGWTVTQIQ